MPDENKRDYYEILGVSRDADAATLKRAFRKKAKECHPDLHRDDPTAGERFKEAQEAYAVLNDPEKRQIYDRYGHAGLEGSGIEGAGFSFSDIFGGLGDLFGFGDIFGGGRGRGRGGGRRQARRQVGQDVEVKLNLTFEEAVFGTEKQVKIRRVVPCSECSGKGGTDVKTCSRCKGSGEERQVQRTAFGQFVNITQCRQCGGSGEEIGTPCSKCKGKKVEIETKKVKVDIPPGVDNGMHMKVPGHGHLPSTDAMPGDAYVKIVVQPHETFKREEQDIVSDLHVDILTATIGGEISCPTIDGSVKLKIPPGTQSHTQFRLKGKGVPYLRSKRKGDHYVLLKVDIPEGITKEQQELLEKFMEIERAREKSNSPNNGNSKKGKKKGKKD